jgi:hypothetical protein
MMRFSFLILKFFDESRYSTFCIKLLKISGGHKWTFVTFLNCWRSNFEGFKPSGISSEYFHIKCLIRRLFWH